MEDHKTQDKTTIPWGAFKAALEWRTEHYAHVQKLAASKEASPPYPPSGSDVFRHPRPRVHLDDLLAKFDPQKHRHGPVLDDEPVGIETR